MAYNPYPAGVAAPKRVGVPQQATPPGTPPPGAVPTTSQLPASTDYMGGALAQGAANYNAANQTNNASRVNQNTPFGSQQFTQNPTTGQWTSNITLAPDQQNLLTAQNKQSTALAGLGTQMANGLGGEIGTPFNLGGAPDLVGAGGFQGQRDAAYKDLMARQNQGLSQQDQDLQQRLADQGITPGSEAYNRAYQPLNQARVDASTQADLASNQLAQSYIDRANQAHQIGVNDLLTQRNQPLSELNAVRSGSQVTTPQFSQYSSANFQPTPIQNAQALQNGYNVGQQQINTSANNNTLNGLFGLGGSVLGSDWFSNLVGGK